MTQLDSQTDLVLGYVFSPPCHLHQLCHRQLDITLHNTPTFQHYDPDVVIFRVAPDKLGNSTIRVRHPWKGKGKYHNLASRVIMRDRVDTVVEAFTFGGELQIASNDRYTKCSLKSPAPILPLFSWSSVETILAEEVEILLAERREVWDEQHIQRTFEQRLAEADPFILYLLSLKYFREKFAHFPSPVPDYLIGFIHFLQAEVKRLHDEKIWPYYLPQVLELL
jgi:hypothetical protein